MRSSDGRGESPNDAVLGRRDWGPLLAVPQVPGLVGTGQGF